jgi:hypothetical protein
MQLYPHKRTRAPLQRRRAALPPHQPRQSGQMPDDFPPAVLAKAGQKYKGWGLFWKVALIMTGAPGTAYSLWGDNSAANATLKSLLGMLQPACAAILLRYS